MTIWKHRKPLLITTQPEDSTRQIANRITTQQISLMLHQLNSLSAAVQFVNVLSAASC
jgi:hypothetical protein